MAYFEILNTSKHRSLQYENPITEERSVTSSHYWIGIVPLNAKFFFRIWRPIILDKNSKSVNAVRTEFLKSLIISWHFKWVNEGEPLHTFVYPKYSVCHQRLSFFFFFFTLLLWLYSPLLGLGLFFSFLILYTVGRTPWTGNQPVARPIPTQNNTNTE
jgi:hypothetical protein